VSPSPYLLSVPPIRILRLWLDASYRNGTGL
jgi:hypothetical protein